jgi:NAD(P)-dependent dehydrogenase (short-subunit alcohol dehydrogenase family)
LLFAERQWVTCSSVSTLQGKQVSDISEISYDRLEFAFKTNIMAMFELAKLALPHMKPGGSIINTSSVVAYQPIPGILDYVCTKVKYWHAWLRCNMLLAGVEQRMHFGKPYTEPVYNVSACPLKPPSSLAHRALSCLSRRDWQRWSHPRTVSGSTA